MASFTFLFFLASPLLLPLFLAGACTRLLPSRLAALMMACFLLPTYPPVPLFPLGAFTCLLPYRLAALMMAFFLLLTSPPVFLLILASGDQDLPPWRSDPPQPASVTPVSCASLSTLWAHPLFFSLLPSSPLPTTSPQQHPALAFLPISSPLPPFLPSLLASLHSLLHLHQVAQWAL